MPDKWDAYAAAPQDKWSQYVVDQSEEPGFTSRFAETTTGFAHPIQQAKSELSQLIDSPGRTLLQAGEQAAQTMLVDLPSAIVYHPIDTLKTLTGGQNFSADIRQGRYGAAAGDVAGGAFNILGPKAISGGLGVAENVAKSGIRRMAGVGPASEAAAHAEQIAADAKAAAAHAEQVAEIQAKQQRTLVSNRSTYEQRVANIEASNQAKVATQQAELARVRAANAESASHAAQRVALMEEAGNINKSISESLPVFAENARASAKAMYPKIEGVIEPTQVSETLQRALDAHLQGTSKVPPAISRIMDELRPKQSELEQASIFRGAGIQARGVRGVPANEAISVMAPEARARFLESLSPQERLQMEQSASPVVGQIDFNTLHGYYSELGRSLSRNMAGDEAAATITARNGIADIMRNMSDAEGKSAEFNAAQKNWAQLENVFYNDRSVSRGGSPIARALSTRDPITKQLRGDYVQRILSDDKQYKIAHEMLGRYPEGKDLQIQLQLMKEKLDQVKTYPKKPKFATEPPPATQTEYPNAAALGPIPTVPEAPTSTPFDAKAFRREGIENLPKRIGRYATPAALIYGASQIVRGKLPTAPLIELGITQAMKNPGFIDWAASPRRLRSQPFAPNIPNPFPVSQQEQKRRMKAIK